MFLWLTYLQVCVNAVLDTQGILILHLKPVAHLLTNFERRNERLHFRLITSTHRYNLNRYWTAVCVMDERIVNSRPQTDVQFTSKPLIYISYKTTHALKIISWSNRIFTVAGWPICMVVWVRICFCYHIYALSFVFFSSKLLPSHSYDADRYSGIQRLRHNLAYA